MFNLQMTYNDILVSVQVQANDFMAYAKRTESVKKNNHVYNGLKPNTDILGAIRRRQDERSNKL